MSCVFKLMNSPVGQLTLVARGTKLAAILWESERENRVRLGPLQPADDHPVLLETERQLNEYFAGSRDCFELELDFVGTEFQRKVWQALLTIPSVKPAATARLPPRSAAPRPCAQSARRMAGTRSRSSPPATG